MVRSPRLIRPVLAELPVRAASRRSRACTSAGPAVASTTSDTPHSGPMATMPPSVTMARMETASPSVPRSEEHTSELQSHLNLVCRLLLEKKNRIGESLVYLRTINNYSFH